MVVAHRVVALDNRQAGRRATRSDPLAAGRPMALGNVQMFDRATRATVVHAAQRSAGNRAVTGAVAQRRTATTATPVVQRWDSVEHVALGDVAGGPTPGRTLLRAHRADLPDRERPPATWPEPWRGLYSRGSSEQQRMLQSGLTYGEVVALSGDFYDGWDALNRAPLREVYDLVALIHRKASTGELQDATGGRYLDLAKRNESHFTNVRPGHRNIDVWWRGHVAAITAARNGDANAAWGQSAMADHFLTDAFSGGHIRVERKRLMDEGALGNVESKILHDLDNEHGVDVTNDRGQTWVAYGDDFLADPRNADNRKLAEEAVVLARRDIADALAQRQGYPEPTARTTFAAQQLVPRAVVPTRDRWTGRTPTYSPGPDGTMVRDADDYTMTRDRVILSEGPGVVAGLWSDDNEVRRWVRRQDVGAIGRQPLGDRKRMIQVLISGPTLDDDEQSILKVLRASALGGDQVAIVDAFDAWELMDQFHGREEDELRVLYRTHYYAGTDQATALRLMVRCAEGVTGEWQEEMIADLLDLRSDRRALVAAFGRAMGRPTGPGDDFRAGLDELDSQVDGAEQDTLDRLFR